jgi:hypothetical protein
MAHLCRVDFGEEGSVEVGLEERRDSFCQVVCNKLAFGVFRGQ